MKYYRACPMNLLSKAFEARVERWGGGLFLNLLESLRIIRQISTSHVSKRSTDFKKKGEKKIQYKPEFLEIENEREEKRIEIGSRIRKAVVSRRGVLTFLFNQPAGK